MKAMTRIRNVGLVLAVFVLGGCGVSISEDELLDRAFSSYESHNFKSAVIDLKSILVENPDHFEGRYLLGRVYMEQGYFEPAKKELDKAQQLNSNDPRVKIALANLSLERGEVDAVYDALSAYAGWDQKEHLDALVALAHANLIEQRNVDAKLLVLRAKEIDPVDSNVLLVDALLQLSTKGADADAMPIVEQALEQNPRNVRALLLLAQLHEADKKYDDAIAAYDKVSDIRLGYLAYPFYSIKLLMDLARFDEAETRLLKVKQKAPDYFLTNSLLTRIYSYKGDYEQAVNYAEKAVEANPRHGVSMYYLSGAYFSQGEFERAYTHAKKALSLVKAPEILKLKAAIELKLGKTDDAVKTLANVERQDFERGDELLLSEMGGALLNIEDVKQSHEYYSVAASISPKSVTANLGKASTLSSLGSIDESIEKILETIENSPENIAAKQTLILGLLQHKRFGDALNKVASFKQKHPDITDGPNLEGLIYARSGQPEKAQIAFSKALELDKSDMVANHNLAVLAAYSDDVASALGYYQNIFEKHPGHPDFVIHYVTLLHGLNRIKESREPLEQAYRNRPESEAIATLLGTTYWKLGNHNKLVELSQDVLRRSPNSVRILSLLAEGQKGLGFSDEAISTYLKIKQVAPEFVPPHYQLALLYDKKGETTKAMESISKAFELAPENVGILVAHGYISLKSGDKFEASKFTSLVRKQQLSSNQELIVSKLEKEIDAYSSAPISLTTDEKIAIYKTNPDRKKMNSIVDGFWQEKRYDEALSILKGWVSDNKNDMDAKRKIASIHLTKKDYQGALSSLTELLEYAPDDIPTLNNIAWVSAKAGDLNKAKSYANKALQLAPESADIRDTLASIMIESGENKEAIGVLEEAHKSNPSHAGVLLNLAKAYGNVGDKEKAIAYLNTLLSDDAGLNPQVLANARSLKNKLQ